MRLAAIFLVLLLAGCVQQPWPVDGSKVVAHFDHVTIISWDSTCNLANVTIKWWDRKVDPDGDSHWESDTLRVKPNATLSMLSEFYKDQKGGHVEETYTAAQPCGGWFATSVMEMAT